MMRALKAQDWGAGALLNAQDRKLRGGTALAARAEDVADRASRC